MGARALPAGGVLTETSGRRGLGPARPAVTGPAQGRRGGGQLRTWSQQLADGEDALHLLHSNCRVKTISFRPQNAYLNPMLLYTQDCA